MRNIASIFAFGALVALSPIAAVACGGAPPDGGLPGECTPSYDNDGCGYGYGSSGSGGGGYGYDAGSPAVPEAGTPEAEAAAAPLPPIPTTPPGQTASQCAGGAAPSAYLWAEDGTLFAFDLTSLETRSLGVVSCPTMALPWTLSVTTSGTAYMLYDDSSLYELDLTTLACQPTAYQPGQLGFTGGEEGITLGAGNTADRLYVYGQGTSTLLGISDLSSFNVFQLGAITPGPAAFPVDLKSDAYGRLFALATGGTLEQLDPATGAILGQDETGFDSTQGGWALLAYDGQLYFFGGANGGVSRYDVSTKALFPIGQVNQTIVGASATPCLSAAASAPPATDAGVPSPDPEGGTEAGPAAPANPFSAGDAWMGTYVCPQGLTNLAVVVESVDGNTMNARFDFDWIAGSTQGSYELTGRFDPTTREATFTPGPWVSQPGSNWFTVGMDGYVDLGGVSYAGNITNPGCGAFSVTR
jgi:hypothetical protein